MSYSIEIATAADAGEIAALHYLSHTTSFAAFATEEFVRTRRLDVYQRQWREFFEKAALRLPGASRDPEIPRYRAWVARAAEGTDHNRETVAGGDLTLSQSGGKGRAIGMVKIEPMPEAGLAQLGGMHVHPDYQGRGIGRALMQHAEAFIREAGYERAILGVVLANHKARALYESSGWKILKELEKGVEGVPYAVCEKRF